jgi:hypothetical protein
LHGLTLGDGSKASGVLVLDTGKTYTLAFKTSGTINKWWRHSTTVVSDGGLQTSTISITNGTMFADNIFGLEGIQIDAAAAATKPATASISLLGFAAPSMRSRQAKPPSTYSSLR